MRIALPLAVLLLSSPFARAATLLVDVRDSRGHSVEHAVVYAVPQGRKLPVAKKTAVMDQKNRMFIPHVLPVQTGTAVSFPNSDDIRHQVYSFSRAKTFQLPLYAGTPANPIVFEKPGVVALGCNIHDRMSAYILVVDTPYFALATNGRGELSEVTAGRYLVHVWYPGMRGDPPPITVTIEDDDRKQLSFNIRRR